MKNYLRYNQRQDLCEERDRIQDALSDPNAKLQDRPSANREVRRINEMLETQTPPELKGDELDRAVKRERELREELIAAMPSAEQMRKKPDGAVEIHRAFERAYKPKILEWKNLRLTIHRDDPNQDVANLELYRPHTKPTQLSMASAEIPGKLFSLPSEQFKAGYDRIDWQPDEDLVKEVAELKATVARLLAKQKSGKSAKRTRKPMSEEAKARQIEALRKGREKAAANRAAKRAAEEVAQASA